MKLLLPDLAADHVVPGAVPARGHRRRPAGPPQRGRHLRHRHRRRARLHRHGAGRRQHPARDAPRRGAPCRRPRRSTSPPRWPTPSSTPTRPASSTATSSRPTSCCAATAGEGGGLRHRQGRGRGAGDRPCQDLTGTGTVLGTAKYLSPEQVDGRPVDGRSDVYALGVVLYEMLCGRPPFVGESDMAIGIQHLDRKPLSPRQVKAGIPRPLEAIVLRAMAKAPADRYANAEADAESATLGGPAGRRRGAHDRAGRHAAARHPPDADVRPEPAVLAVPPV